MNKRSKAMVFSFLSTLLTLAIGSRVGACYGHGLELLVILTGLAITLVIGAIINSPDKSIDTHKPRLGKE
jgi:hypothetical protein